MDAFEPKRFREQGHALVDQLADYLEDAESRRLPVLPASAYGALDAQFSAAFPAEPTTNLHDLLERVLAHSNHLHHPRYIGHQVTSPLPSVALLSLVSALLNNGMAVHDMGPAGTQMELSLMRFLASRLGWDDRAEGVLTSGGSLGNLTALLAARRARAGNERADHLALLVSEQAHYSVERAATIMGWGPEGIIKVPVDDICRIRVDALPSALSRAGSRRVVALVGSACSTTTGAFDPLDELADFCERHDLWFHVDGAHGASAALSTKYASLLRGIERADSVVWDAHKMLLVPALVTAVLFRDGRHSHATFVQEAEYLFRSDADSRESRFNVGRRTLECTKRMMGLELYGALALHGTRYFDAYVTSRFDLGRRFAEMLGEEEDFEVPVPPACNIVCFRYRPSGDDQARIAEALAASGRFYIVSAKLAGRPVLRVTIVNPLTTEEDLRALVVAIRELA